MKVFLLNDCDIVNTLLEIVSEVLLQDYLAGKVEFLV